MKQHAIFQIHSVVMQSASEVKFEFEGHLITIEQYYRQKYKLQLKYAKLLLSFPGNWIYRSDLIDILSDGSV